MDDGAVRCTRQRLLYMHCEYRHYMNCDVRDISSAGMVAAFSPASSGGTNRISDLTAMHAVQLTSIPPDKLLSLKWMDCAWRVFMRGTVAGLNGGKLRLNERRNRTTVSYVLYHKAFMGRTFREIADMGLPSGAKVSLQRVHDYWELAVREVAQEARREGLV